MEASRSALTFTPDADAVETLRSEWAWLLPAAFSPVLFSVLGDMFFLDRSGEVFWLNTGTGEVVTVACSAQEFQKLLATEQAGDWFLPDLIEKLRSCGKIAGPGECYTYAILPVFPEGKYEEWNFAPVPAREHFALTAHIHKSIAGLPDGSRVRLSVEE